MKFPNAAKGVKKLFIANLVAVIAGILALVSAVMAAIGLKNDPVLIAAGSVALVATIILIVVFIVQLVGLYQGGKDNALIKAGFYLTIAGIIFTVIGTIFKSITAVPALVTIGGYLIVIVDGITVVALFYVLRGIAHLCEESGDEGLASHGRRLSFIVLILFVISIVLSLYSNILGNSTIEWVKTTIAVAGIVAAITELIVSLLVLIYYGRASKLLNK